MEFSRNGRAVAVLLLLAVLFSLLVWGGMEPPPAPELGSYPGVDDVAMQPERYLDQQVSIVARVVSTDPVLVRAEYGTGTSVETIEFTVTDVGTPVTEGDTLQIFGVLTGPETVRATNVVVVPQSGLWYAYVTSFVGGLWVLARLVRQWTVDTTTGAFRPRTGTLRLFGRGGD